MAQSLFKRALFSIYTYCVIYALFGILSLSYHACFNSSLSTLEKRFHFSSQTGGLIMITDNIATVITNLFIGFYGTKAHKPRWMAIGCVVTGVSVMITALPYFIFGPIHENDLDIVGNRTIAASRRNSADDRFCSVDSVSEDCSQSTADANKLLTMVAVSCFALSNFFRGFGTSIYFTLGMPYLDDNVSKASMPTFFAIIFAARILGAPLGFMMSSWALKIYENPFLVPAGLTDTDPRWIGAWWIGFLISGTLMIMLAIPLAFFPREFRKKKPGPAQEVLQLVDQITLANTNKSAGASTNQAISSTNTNQKHELTSSDMSEISPIDTESVISTSDRRTQVNEIEEAKHNERNGQEKPDMKLADLPSEIMKIIKNPLIACQMMGNMFRGIGIIGYFVFQTKYLESQFRQSASKASLVTGTTGFLAKFLGVIVGGLLITLIRPGPRVLTTFIFLVELTSVFTLLYGSTVLGPQYLYPGTTSVGDTGLLNLKNECNTKCNCDNVSYQPVCEFNSMNSYFSPCHAGCKYSFKHPDDSRTYAHCECIEGSGSERTVEKCQTGPEQLMKYATIVALGGMISGSSRPGNMVTFFRSMNPEQKPLVTAVSGFWHSLMVSIPYPIIYGALFDACCLVWHYECGKRGNCWMYDTEKLRAYYHGLSIALIAIGSLFDLIMIYLSPRFGQLYDEEDYKKQQAWKNRLMFWKPRGAKKTKYSVEQQIYSIQNNHNTDTTPKPTFI